MKTNKKNQCWQDAGRGARLFTAGGNVHWPGFLENNLDINKILSELSFDFTQQILEINSKVPK